MGSRSLRVADGALVVGPATEVLVGLTNEGGRGDHVLETGGFSRGPVRHTVVLAADRRGDVTQADPAKRLGRRVGRAPPDLRPQAIGQQAHT